MNLVGVIRIPEDGFELKDLRWHTVRIMTIVLRPTDDEAAVVETGGDGVVVMSQGRKRD